MAHASSPAPEPNPIAGYEDWPAAVRGAAPFEGSSAGGNRAGRGSRPAPATADTDVSWKRVAARSIRWTSAGCAGRWATGRTPRPGCCGRPACPAISRLSWACTATAVCARWAVSSSSSSGTNPIRGRPPCAPAGIRAAPRPMSWPGGASSCWSTTRSPGAAGGSTCRIRLHDSRALLEAYAALWREQGLTPSADEQFDLASSLHEDTIAKAAGALGQTFAGAVLTDDLVALDVLAGTDGVDPDRCRRSGSPAEDAAACCSPRSTIE